MSGFNYHYDPDYEPSEEERWESLYGIDIQEHYAVQDRCMATMALYKVKTA